MTDAEHRELIELQRAEISRLQAKNIRQKAEIEALDFLIKESNKIAERQDKEIERLQAHNSSMQSTLAKMSMGVEQAKAEAIKEFAEKLKEIYATHDGLWITIDNLVKEMIGE